MENAPAHGWFHALAAEVDADWQKRLHKAHEVREVALSPFYSGTRLLPLNGGPHQPFRPICLSRIAAGVPIALRVTFTDDERARQFCHRLSTISIPRLGLAPCILARIPHLHSEDPDVYHASWAQLTNALPARRLHLRFETQTFFSHQGEMRLLPEPDLLWADWRDAWKLLAPALPMGAETLTLNGLYIARYRLHTEQMPLEGGHPRGFVGDMSLTWDKNAPTETRRTAAALAGIADFTGTGAKTMLGLGQTRLTVEE